MILSIIAKSLRSERVKSFGLSIQDIACYTPPTTSGWHSYNNQRIGKRGQGGVGVIREAAKGTGYGNDNARDLLRRAGVNAFRKQAGYVPKVDDKEIDPVWIVKNCIVPYRRDWRKELFSSVHPVAVEPLAHAFHVWLYNHGFTRCRNGCNCRAFVLNIVKQNRKFVDRDAA